MWNDKQITVKILNGFTIKLPELILRDPKERIIRTDYHGKVILLTLLMNEFVPDIELKRLAKSYKSVMCNLRKVSEAHGYRIHRSRGKGYYLTIQEHLPL